MQKITSKIWQYCESLDPRMKQRTWLGNLYASIAIRIAVPIGNVCHRLAYGRRL